MKKADKFNPGKWLVENKITNQSRLNENQQENYLNSLLEKIFEEGIDSLSLEEKEYLDSVSKGTNSKTPDEYLQDLFNEWKDGEVEAGNDIDNIYHWSDLYKFDQELQDGFLSYVNLVKKYPNLDKEDLAMLNSLSYQKEFDGTPIYMPYSDYDWNSLDKKTYHKILFDEFGIEPYEDEDEDDDGDDDEAYIKEFGFSWGEKQNWEEIKDQIFNKKYKFNWFDSKHLKNYQKIEDEAKQAYIDKYGSPKYKKYPF